MIYLGLILKIVGLWSLICFSLVGLWCSLRWIADRRARRARANVQHVSDEVRLWRADASREWLLARSRERNVG